MSNEKDTVLSIKFHEQLIKNHISIKMCKECISFNATYITCKKETPNPGNCNLLKILRRN